MSDAYIGEIRIFASSYAPQAWLPCNGQPLSRHAYPRLFEVLGYTYGGDGDGLFALPDLRGRLPLGAGHGAGLAPRLLADTGGQAEVTLTSLHLPSHGHEWQATDAVGTVSSPASSLLAKTAAPFAPYHAAVDLAALPDGLLEPSGGGQPHNNLQPYMNMIHAICHNGVYPPRP